MKWSPGLLRIICIDAHIAGKRMEVKLPHHANISGSNGSGKTTLLKLIPFFYGATSSELVERVGKKSSFTDYYLSRPTSLIVFEYGTPRGPKCVAVYRHTTGMKPAYRFLDEPFAVEYFSEEREGKPVFIEGRSLGRHWTMQRLGHSNQLDVVTDYRAVIQGDRSLIHRSTQSRELLPLVSMYSLGGVAGSMGHIHKMTAAILSRRGSMEGIKQMIAEIMREEQIELPPLKLHKNVRDVVAELSVLRNLDKNQALFRKVVSLGVSHYENSDLLQHAGIELHSYAAKIKHQVEELDSQIALNREALKVLKSRWEDNSEEIRGQLQNAKHQLHTTERQLNELDQAYQRWGEQDILSKKADYENLGEYAEALSDARQHQRALETGVADLKQHYDELKQQEQQRHHEKNRKLEKNKMLKMQAKNEEEKRWLEQTRAIEKDKHQALKNHRDKRQVDVDHLYDELTKQRFAAENILPTDNERLALEDAENQRDQFEEVLSQANKKCTQISARAEAQRVVTDNAEKALANARKVLSSEQLLHDQLMDLCNPKPGAFLSELRDQDPDWHGTLGKVIRQDILTRKDLAPVYHAGALPDLMGWSLNLEKVGKPEWACSLEEQEQRLDTQEARLNLAEQQCGLKKADSDKALKALNALQDEREEADRQMRQASRRYDSAREAVRTVKDKNQQAAAERKHRAQERLTVLTRNMDELKQRIDEEIAEIEARFADSVKEAQSLHFSQLSLIEEELGIIESGLAEEKQRNQTALMQIQQEFTAQCAAEGLDEKVLDVAIDQVKKAKEDHDRVCGYQDAVLKYDYWYHNEWPRRSEYEERRAQAATQANHFDTLYKDAERLYKSERDDLNHQHSRWRDEKTIQGDRREACLQMLKRADLALTTQIVDELRPLDAVLAETESLLAAQQQIIKQVRSGIGKVESVIASQGERNQIADAWQHLKQTAESGLTDPGNMDLLNINLTRGLDELMRVHLPQKMQTIKSFVRTISDQLADFYVGLNQVSKLINQQSRAISNSISEKQYFAAIGNIGVSLQSRIDSQDYWPYLTSFEGAYRAWKEADEGGLPPENLDEKLISVTDILHRSQLAKGIESVFDLEISLEENARVVTVTNSRDLENASSNGLSYLILCSIFAGITRMLCRDREIRIHWPVDELGVIDSVNVASLFRMLNDHNIVMVGGFPTTDPLLLQHFTDRHEMRKDQGLVDIQLPEDKLSTLMMDRRKQSHDARERRQ